MAFRIYVTDTLRVLTENTARFAGGTMMNVRYIDMISRKKHVETKSGDEIAADFVARAGLELA